MQIVHYLLHAHSDRNPRKTHRVNVVLGTIDIDDFESIYECESLGGCVVLNHLVFGICIGVAQCVLVIILIGVVELGRKDVVLN